MFGFLKRGLQGREVTRPPRRITARTDWETLNREIYARVIEGGKFCVGIVSAGDGMPGQLKFRMNQEFPGKQVTDYIRTRFKPPQFDSIMATRAGLAVDGKYGLFKVTSDKLGLPLKCMVMPITSTANSNLKSLLIFGGEFLENQMATRLGALDNLLGRGERSAKDQRMGKGGRTRGELIEMLEGINTKRLFDYELAKLAEITNGLEETRDQLPRELRPKFGAIHQYFMSKRLN